MIDVIPADFTQAAGVAVILGFFIPIVMNFINDAGWANWVKAVLTFVVSAIVGTITAFYAGAYEGLGIPSTIILTFVVAIAAYRMGWKNWFPNMQRGSARVAEEKAVEERIAEKALVAETAERVIADLPVAEVVVADPNYPNVG